ncbi:MAG: adenylyl-sulfate kinase [Chloroflexi bacterium]|nr:adenylyl-sulfate kinase [Chloroflexota bacterium]
MESITLVDRTRLNHHEPAVLWFTGLSGSGKSTIANAVEYRLYQEFHAHTFLLDGDIIRKGLNSDLDFSDAGRKENIRRIAEVTRLFYEAGLILLTTFISPFRAERDYARSLLPDRRFVEIFVSCPFEVCESRDPKGLYRKARSGLIKDFTGLGSAYETPDRPEIRLETATQRVENCSDEVIAYLLKRQIITK